MTPSDTAAVTSGRRPRPPGVLVVDDNEPIRALLDVVFRANGFAVWLAADGPAGLAVSREYGPDIDLLLLDVRMPGWDGPETLAAIRATAPQVTCCFMSGDLGDYTERELLDLGAAVVFRKPFQLNELTLQVRSLTAPEAGAMRSERPVVRATPRPPDEHTEER